MALYKSVLLEIEGNVAIFRDEPPELIEVSLSKKAKERLRSHIGAELYFLSGTKGELLGFCPAYLWTDVQEYKESVEDTMEDVDTETDKRDDLIDTLHDETK